MASPDGKTLNSHVSGHIGMSEENYRAIVRLHNLEEEMLLKLALRGVEPIASMDSMLRRIVSMDVEPATVYQVARR